MTDTGQTGRLEFHREGFNVLWNERGLSIQVVDYHCETLQLSWETILDLAKRARSTTPPKKSSPNVIGSEP